MPLTIPKPNKALEYLARQWEPYYAELDRILGDTYTQVPFGDPFYGVASAVTFPGRRKHTSGLAPTWTPSEALSAWDTVFSLADRQCFKGIIPIIVPNGTDERIHTPDVAYFSRGTGTADIGFAIAAWVWVTASTARKLILCKDDESTAQEWTLEADAAEKISLTLYDESVPTNCSRLSDAAVSTGAWHHVVVTYDGGGGATAANGITIYLDGKVLASTATNSGTYVAMENLGAKVSLFASDSPLKWFTGRCAGGPNGPIFSQVEPLSSGVGVKALYELGKEAMDL